MTYADISNVRFFFIGKKYIDFDYVQKITPHLLAEGPKGAPTGKPVADKRPIDPKNHIEKENIGCGKVNKTNRSEPVRITGLCVGHNGWRVGDNKPGYCQYGY